MYALDFIEVHIFLVSFFFHFKKKTIEASTACCHYLLTCSNLSHLPAFDLGMVTALWPFLSIAGR